jgi:TolA-binding protein
VGQLVEVPFRGTGWVYLGELGSRPGIVYSGRRLDPEGQSFVFRAEAAGTYGLKFYKQDFVRDYVLNDHVQVVVGDPPEAAATGWFNPAIDRGRVVAEPRWPNTQEEAEAFGRASGASSAGSTGAVVHGVSPAGNAATVPDSVTAAPEATSGNGQAAAAETSPGATGIDAGQPVPTGASPTPGSPAAAPPAAQATGTTPSLQNKAGGLDEGVVTVRPASAVPPEPRGDLLPSGYLERAQQEFDAGRVATAIAALDQFRERYPAGSDEAWWLYGQFYEAPTAYRDIRTSLDYYRRLVREYPQSSRYNEARRRIAYLERYYINIQ